MQYYSDTNKSNKLLANEIISVDKWESIRNLIVRYIKGKFFAKEFPMMCEDGNGRVFECDVDSLQRNLNSVVPQAPSLTKQCVLIENRFDPEDEQKKNQFFNDDVIRTYAVLDTIEFLYSHITDYEEGDYHERYRHYHLKFKETDKNKQKFREEINDIFRRNKMNYELSDDGKIRRTFSVMIAPLLNVDVKTNDEELNKLINEAVTFYQNPKVEDRQRGIEKLWDAYERLKTEEKGKKNKSIEDVLKKMSEGDEVVNKLLDKEGLELRYIGNNFRIRHHETDKKEITANMMDYFFFRCLTFVHLFLKYYNER